MKTKWIIFFLVFMVLGVGVYFAFVQSQDPIVKTVEITLTVNPAPDFMLGASISHIDTRINQTIGFAVNVTSLNEFAGEVEIEVTGLPPEMLIGYFPGQILTVGIGQTTGISIDIQIPDDATLVGDYTIVVTATSTTYN